MCGIAGILMHKGYPDEQAISILARSLEHRGPDGSGQFNHEKTVVLHKRLSIIDLETGNQPIQNQDGSVIIANGEIYNYQELRGSLGEKNFQTNSDSEAPLVTYGLNGTAFTQGLRGMYAIAIVDIQTNNIQLARDPFGIKPLYYTKFKDGIAFSSEAGSLLDAGLAPRKLHDVKRDEFLQLQFTTGEDTVFEGIKRVMPGQTLSLDNHDITKVYQQNSLPDSGPENWSQKEALQKLDEALMDSVMVHQRSDVPYGMFLSGGVDSSVILACMRDLNEKPVEAFTAGFSGTSVNDERDHAQTVAAAAGANFNNVEFSESNFWELLPEIAAVMDDPAADYAILPTYKLGKTCHDAGLKVVLSGAGGETLSNRQIRNEKMQKLFFCADRYLKGKSVSKVSRLETIKGE